VEIQALLGGKIMEDCEPYLLLPMIGGRSKVNTFKGLQGKITKKVMGWKGKFISKAGGDTNQNSGPSHPNIHYGNLQNPKCLM